MDELFLEQAWDDLLSRDPEKIKRRFGLLDRDSQLTVENHLRNMISEDGWHPEQVLSAQAALDVINKQDQ